jgi:signal-transduction protein with cAMP-binding, CBS, and nucleotidyltransferase domain
MADEERIAWLRASALFAPLAETELERLADALVRLAFRAGASIVRAGDVVDYVYLVVAGEVELGDRVLVAGELFGGPTQTGAAIARSDVTLYAFDGASLPSA